MTILTATDVRNRIMTLCETIVLPSPLAKPHAYRDLQECSWKASSLPAIVVKPSPQGPTYDYADASGSYYTSREFTLGLYLSHITDESYAKDLDSVDLAENAAAYVVHFFAGKKNLATDDDMGLVEIARLDRNTAPHTMPTTGSTTKNRGIQFRMTVRWLNFAPPTGR